MTIGLYVVWFLIPLFFFGVALFSYLEQLSGKSQYRDNTTDFFKQGCFVLICVLISFLIDQYLILTSLEELMPDWLPLWFPRVVLLPLVLYLGSMLVGPTKDLRISEISTPGGRKKRR